LRKDNSDPWGFTLVELLVVLGIMTVLIAMLLPALQLARRAAYTVICASNMRQIGVAFALYAQDNQGLYPWAECNYPYHGTQAYISWDDLINHELGGDLREEEELAAYAPRPMKVLHCPADDTPRSTIWYAPATGPFYPRSYAMPRVFGPDPLRHLMFRGIGGQMSGSLSNVQLCIKSTWVPRPTQTLLLVEEPCIYNNLGWIGQTAAVDKPLDQVYQWRSPSERYHDKSNHGSGWNYLFCDRHVELLTLEQTVRNHGSWYATVSNYYADYMWTRDPND
jgi:hypothetical protein